MIAAVAAVCASARAAPVTWSFFETGISCEFSSGSCSLPPQPFVFATLTLPGPTSSGRGFWSGTGTTPVYTGDSFIFRVHRGFGVSSAFVPGEFLPRCDGGPDRICDFDISWSEIEGQLVHLAITLDTLTHNIGGGPVFGHDPFGLNGGMIATDSTDLGGCNVAQCEITGFWQSDLPVPVPEPGSFGLLLSGILVTWVAWRCRPNRARITGQG
jgi:PEP-CTERM motif